MKHLLSAVAFTSLVSLAACGDPSETNHLPDAPVVEEPANLWVSADPKLPILQGAVGYVQVTVERREGENGPVVITAEDLPPGVIVEELVIDATETSAMLGFKAMNDAPHSLPTQIQVRGTMGTSSSVTPVTLTVYGPPGSLDTSFGGGRVMLPAGASDDYANAIVVQSDGKIVLGGRGSEHQGDFAMIRLDRDGNVDTTFGDNGRVLTDFAGRADNINALVVQNDGKIVAVGSTVGANSTDFALARYLPDGSLDASFGQGGKVVHSITDDTDIAYAALVTVDGFIVAGGSANRGTTSTGVDFALARFASNGQLDRNFGDQGVTLSAFRPGNAGDHIYALAFQPLDGEQRIVAAGGEGDMVVARYRSSGALDTDFGVGGSVLNKLGSTIGAAYAVAITPEGNIALAGHSHNDVALLQLGYDGSVDELFGTLGKVITPVTTNWDSARAIAIDSLGKLVVAGWAWEGNSSAGNFVTIRYLTDGTLDPSFGPGGIVTTQVAAGTKADESRAIAIQVDDRVPTHRLVVGGFANNANADFAVTRFWR
jgi:uncharacterized delta-60 repeat protein